MTNLEEEQLDDLKSWMKSQKYDFVSLQWANFGERRVAISIGARTVWATVRRLNGTFSLHASPTDYASLSPDDLNRFFGGQRDQED